MKPVLPAEWAPQRAVMLTWPRLDGDFSGIYPKVEQNFIQLARAITRFEPLIVSRESDLDALRRQLIDAGVPAKRLSVFAATSDDVWARDHGPITVIRDGRLVHLDFTFNGWGGKFSAEHDNRLTRTLHVEGALPGALETIDFVLEGGGIESDGQGTLLTTRRCLLAPTRNPGLDAAQIEARLKSWFGLTRVLWLDHGDLLGDDTDGHIDTLARFCNPQTIAYQGCADPADPHFDELAAMAEELRALRRSDGKPYLLVELPLPAPILDDSGRRLPAGYANFLIVNGAVLVPTYGDRNDAPAMNLLAGCFPGREIVGVDCRALIHQYGSLHCVTMQIPAV